MPFIKIPAIFTPLDRRTVKEAAVFYALKMFFYNGLIYNFKSRRAGISQAINISASKLRYMESALIRRGLAHWNGKHLQLTGYRVANEILKIKTKRFIKIKSTDVDAIENFLRAVNIKNNLKKQRYVIDKKIICAEINNIKAAAQLGIDYEKLTEKTSQRFSKNALKKISKRILTANNGEVLQRYERAARTIYAATVSEYPAIDTTATLSCAGIARVCLGASNPSTGYYLAQRLKMYGYITIQADTVPIAKGVHRQAAMFEPVGIGGRKFRTLKNRVNIEF